MHVEVSDFKSSKKPQEPKQTKSHPLPPQTSNSYCYIEIRISHSSAILISA